MSNPTGTPLAPQLSQSRSRSASDPANPSPARARADDALRTDSPPAHHLHKASDSLSRGDTYDYSVGFTDDPRSYPQNERESSSMGPDTRQTVSGGQFDRSGTGRQQETAKAKGPGMAGESAYTQERPLGVQPTERGGVAVGGEAGLPEGHATMADKVIGKTQKVAGKMMHNPEMHEKGELREAGGKAAAQGQARAPHD